MKSVRLVYGRSVDLIETDFAFHFQKIDTPLCSARRLDEVYGDLKDYLHHDLSLVDYYNEHLNYIGDGSIAEVRFVVVNSIPSFDSIQMFQHYESLPASDHKMSASGASGLSRSQSTHQWNQYTMQNTQNEHSDMKQMFKELESKLSQHSLNVLNESKENNEPLSTVITTKE